MRDLSEVLDGVKDVDTNINSILVPILKDSIKDGNHHNKRLFVINMMLVLTIMVISVTAMIVISLQNKKYIEFLSQFEFEGESTIYQETEDNSTINSGININK